MQSVDDNRIGWEEAESLARDAIIILDEKHPARSGLGREIETVSFLRFGQVKSSILETERFRGIEISDTLAYVFNFRDSLGYAIISKDDRAEVALLALTKKGSLINGRTNNPGLKMFLRRMEGYVLESIVKSEETKRKGIKKDRAMVSMPRSPVFVGPLIPVEWGQHQPFWNNLKNTSCASGHDLAGCVATALAQLMTYYESPSAIDGVTYDWTLLSGFKHWNDFNTSTTATNMVANLFQQIGTGINMRYGCDVSTAFMFNAYAYLLNLGYSSAYGFPYMQNYSLISAIVNIGGCAPLLAFGCDYYIGGCHAWIMDGYMTYNNYAGHALYFIHNNWGWDGYDNGYYFSVMWSDDFGAGGYSFEDVTIGVFYN
jgi:hypothetical protein